MYTKILMFHKKEHLVMLLIVSHSVLYHCYVVSRPIVPLREPESENNLLLIVNFGHNVYIFMNI